MKKYDIVLLKILLFIISVLWSIFLIKKTYLGFLVGLLIYTLLLIVLKLSLKKIKNPSINKLSNHLALMGSKYSNDLIFKLISPEFSPYLKDGNIYIKKNNQDELVFVNYKFSASSTEDLAKAIRISMENNINNVHFITSSVDRRSLSILNNCYVRFNFINIKTIYKALEQKKLMPEINSKLNAVKPSLAVLRVAFNRSNSKNYAFAGIILGLMSFITPLRLYYLIISSISMVLAMICLVNPSKKQSIKNNIFKQ